MTNAASIQPPVPPATPAPEFAPAPKHDWLRIILFAAVILGAGLFVAAPAFYGTWLWDDDQEISANAAVQSVNGSAAALKDIWTPGRVGADYLPVKTTFLWAEWKVFTFLGMQIDNIYVGYHVINVIFHLINALLIWNLFYRLKIKWAWLGGLLFAIHPILVESVAWVTEQKNTLSLIFMLLSMIYFINYHERGRMKDIVISVIMFAASALSKSAVIMLPFCLILYAWWRDNTFKWRDLFLLLAVLCAAVAIVGMVMGIGAMLGIEVAVVLWGLIRFALVTPVTILGAAMFGGLWWMIRETDAGANEEGGGQTAGSEGGELNGEWKYSGKFALTILPFFVIMAAVSAITVYFQFGKAIGQELIPVGGMVSRAATAGMATWFYLLKCIWPFALPPMTWFSSAFGYGLVPIYERWDVVHPSFMQLVVPWLAMAAAVVWFAFNRKTWGRHMIFGLGFFFGNLVPALGFVTMSYMRITWVADHFVYISIIGILGLVVAGAAALYEKIPSMGKPWYIGLGVIAIGFLTWNASFYSHNFLDETNMWEYTLSKNPDAWQAHSRYGKVLLDNNKNDAAFYHIQQSNRLRPDLAETNNNMGVLLLKKNRGPEALPYFRRAVRLMPIGAFLFNYANALTQQQQGAEAVPAYEKLLRMNGGPYLANYINSRGVAALNMLFSEQGGVTLGDLLKPVGPPTDPSGNNKNVALERMLRNKSGDAFASVLALQGTAALRKLIELHASDTLDDMLKVKSADDLEQLVKKQGGKALENLLRQRGVLDDVLKMNGGDTIRAVFNMDAGNEAFFGLRATRGSDAYEALVMMMRPNPLEYLFTLTGGDKLRELLNANGSNTLMKFHSMEGTEAYNIIADMMGGDPVIRLQEIVGMAATAGGDPAQRLAELGISDQSLVFTNYAAALMQAGRRDEAIRAFQTAIMIRPIPETMINYALTLTQIGRGPEALPTYERLMQVDTYANNPGILASYGIALFQAKRKDDAIRVLERALQINPNMPDVQKNLDLIRNAQPLNQTPPTLQNTPGMPLPIPGATDPSQMPIPAIFQNK